MQCVDNLVKYCKTLYVVSILHKNCSNSMLDATTTGLNGPMLGLSEKLAAELTETVVRWRLQCPFMQYKDHTTFHFLMFCYSNCYRFVISYYCILMCLQIAVNIFYWKRCL